MYSELSLTQILKTMDTLQKRIGERFPGSGLEQVAAELRRVGEETHPVLARAA